jgi:E3 ubiquitin-protein ligase RGLG
METFKNGRDYRAADSASSGSTDFSIVLIVIACVVIYVISQFPQLSTSLANAWQQFGSSVDSSITSGSTRIRPSAMMALKKRDPFNSLSEVQAALRTAGVECSNLILGIDFTKSNTWSGTKTFGGFCLHDTSRKGVENPYQKVMRIVSRTLSGYDEDSLIPAFGFGDIYTKATSCFPFFPDRHCHGLNEVLDRYNDIVGEIEYSGPTNFAPVIREAIKIVKDTKQFHILVIIADGQVDKVADTISAIVDASQHPLSIVCIGVGDGPWDMMENFDDSIPKRRFDNFQFVDLNSLEKKFHSSDPERFEAEFACAALMEIPEQYIEIRKLGIM